MKSISGSFCCQCIFNFSSKNKSSAEMQWGVLPFCVRGKAEAAVWFLIIILSLKGDVDCGSSIDTAFVNIFVSISGFLMKAW